MNKSKSQLHNRIFIEEDKEFTLDEFAHLVARAIRSVAGVDIDKDKVVIHETTYISQFLIVLATSTKRTPGRFKIDQTKFQNYLIHYVPDSIVKKDARKGTSERLGTYRYHA